jgi:hypothetical protein
MTPTARPKARAMAGPDRLLGKRSATMMAPQPQKTRQKVPVNSASNRCLMEGKSGLFSAGFTLGHSFDDATPKG